MNSIYVAISMVVVCTAVSALGQADTLAVDTLIIVEVKALYSEMDSTLADSVVSYARLFIGKPYAYGSTSGKSFDCSGYTQFVFSKHDIQLARSSSSQAEQCEKIKPRKASKGDLIFFTGRNSKSKNVGHVGIVTEVDGDRIRMIHATVHGGVMEEWYNDSDYFRKRMLFVGRIAK